MRVARRDRSDRPHVVNAQDFGVRLAGPGDVQGLPEIERQAGQLFDTYPADLGLSHGELDRVTPIETFERAQQAGHLWVAASRSGAIAGFALVADVDGYAYLGELDVIPDCGERGIGSALLATVCAWARTAGYPAVTLRTFRDVPWNGPFYLRRGFRIVESAALSPGHVELEWRERQSGLRTDLRVTMMFQTFST